MLKMGSISINGTSQVDGMDAVYFNASFSENGTYTISKNVSNAFVYEANKAECDADYAEFEAKAKGYDAAVKSME